MTSPSTDHDVNFKLLLIGDHGVGKSRLILRYTENRFTDNYYYPSVDFRTKTVEIDNEVIKLYMWDTAGRERFRPMPPMFYRRAHGIIIVFDITNSDSFYKVPSWLEEIDKVLDHKNAKLLVGNKSDLEKERSVSYENALIFAKENDMPYIETSAKTGINVEKAFTTIVEEMKQRYDDGVYQTFYPRSTTLDTKNSVSAGWLWPCAC